MNKQNFSSMTLLIIEDDTQTREHFVEVLEMYFKKVIAAVDGCDARTKIASNIPDIIISDIKMPCLDGISLIKEVKDNTYKPIVVFTTAFSEQEYLLEAIDIHVDAYLIKPINVHQLLEKISDAINSYDNINLKYKKLSTREYEVFLNLAAGRKPAEIAQQYDIKSKTISTYRRRIFEKMGFHSNAELITYAIKNHLI